MVKMKKPKVPKSSRKKNYVVCAVGEATRAAAGLVQTSGKRHQHRPRDDVMFAPTKRLLAVLPVSVAEFRESLASTWLPRVRVRSPRLGE